MSLDLAAPAAAPPLPEPAGLARRDLLLGGVFVGAAALAYARLPRTPVIAVPTGPIDGLLPTAVAGWGATNDPSLVQPPEDEQAAASVYEDQISRSYLAPGASETGDAIMLVLAYARSQSALLMVHRPESCYPGSGFTITDNRPASIPLAPGLTLPARFLSAERGERVEQILYWTRLGNVFPTDWDQERSMLALENLRGRLPDGALVRLSVISSDPEASLVLLRRFAATLFQASGRDGRALLAGPASA